MRTSTLTATKKTAPMKKLEWKKKKTMKIIAIKKRHKTALTAGISMI